METSSIAITIVEKEKWDLPYCSRRSLEEANS